jgi:hypothetical protein
MPAVHAGPPQKDSDYFIHDLKGTPFYIHNNLIESQIEVFKTGASLTGSLAAKEY